MTPEVKRFVFVYLVEAQGLYLVDSGVAGSETQILGHVARIGRSPSELRGIFLTLAHPDHIGTAAMLRERFGCPVYASAGGKPWIEDIDRQFQERPIPSFYSLAGRSCPVDCCLAQHMPCRPSQRRNADVPARTEQELLIPRRKKKNSDSCRQASPRQAPRPATLPG